MSVRAVLLSFAYKNTPFGGSNLTVCVILLFSTEIPLHIWHVLSHLGFTTAQSSVLQENSSRSYQNNSLTNEPFSHTWEMHSYTNEMFSHSNELFSHSNEMFPHVNERISHSNETFSGNYQNCSHLRECNALVHRNNTSFFKSITYTIIIPNLTY